MLVGILARKAITPAHRKPEIPASKNEYGNLTIVNWLKHNTFIYQHNTFSSRGFATDGAARAEIKLAYSLPSRDGGRQLVNPRVI